MANSRKLSGDPELLNECAVVAIATDECQIVKQLHPSRFAFACGFREALEDGSLGVENAYRRPLAKFRV